ncbi:MAG: class I SAM-dependent methyltransferase [Actinobacteria bacterium]|nr:class I SAM-dependent methyltransferase [Actinomycetota bacterium]
MPDRHWRCSHDDEERKRWQDPDQVLRSIGLGPGMVLADIGCGEGFFAIPAAEIVGPDGLIYAVNADEEAVVRLEETARKLGLGNIIAIAGEGESTVLCDECADIVFLGIVLHDFSDAERALQNARRIIKPDGKLVNVDWKKEQAEIGPPEHIRFDEEKASKLITNADFEVEFVGESGEYHYIITAKPV